MIVGYIILKKSIIMVKTLEEAVEELYPRFEGMDEYFDKDEDYFASFCHSQLSGGIGMKIRNEYGFWQDSELKKHMETVHNCKHPDDMSDLIIRHIWRKRNKNEK